MCSMESDLEISQQAKIKNIVEIAEELGLSEEFIEPYGKYKAKIILEALKTPIDRKGKYILVSAITPTPLGEGKTVTTIGLSMALNKIGKKAAAAVRQPSMGPVFGIKGGAAGGGYAQVVPMEEFNLHLTGDIHAVSIAHNLLAAFIDNHIYHGNQLNIDQFSITWPRVVDISDRALRNIIIGLGERTDGIPRQSGFDIAVASEVMAIIALAKDIFDLRKMCGRIIIGATKDKKPVTAEDLKCAGAMTVVLRDAIKPTLMQTLENTPCLIHAGPFGNIAHGNSSIIADYIGLKYCDYVVTEAGFGADMGAEKFVNIKCRVSGLKPDACVLVCSIRALKMHSGKYNVVAGKQLPQGLLEENLVALVQGFPNLIKQIENIQIYGIPIVVAINKFPTDTEKEIELVKQEAKQYGVSDVVVSEVFAKGSEGGIELAEAVVKASEKPFEFKFLYPGESSIKNKIKTIVTKVYGGDDADFLPESDKDIDCFEKWGFGHLPICMAKTHLSISHDPKLKGRPKGFQVPIRDIRIASGAGFLYPMCGDMVTMPGLPSLPGGTKVDIDEAGNIVGLF